jgi:hypothetical protein
MCVIMCVCACVCVCVCVCVCEREREREREREVFQERVPVLAAPDPLLVSRTKLVIRLLH